MRHGITLLYVGIVLSAALPLGSPTRPEAIRADTDPNVMDDPVIKEIAQKHSVSPALVNLRSMCDCPSNKVYCRIYTINNSILFIQVCIAYTLCRGIMVQPKSTYENEILENIEATRLELDEEDRRRLKELNREQDKNSRLLKVESKLWLC